PVDRGSAVGLENAGVPIDEVPDELIIAETAGIRAGAGADIEVVIAAVAVHDFAVLRPGDEVIVAVPAGDSVFARAAGDQVVVAVAEQLVRADAAEDRVVARAAVDAGIAAAGGELIRAV